MDKNSNRNVQYLVALSVSIASFTLGVASAWATPVIPKLSSNQTDIQMTKGELSWMLAVNSPGFMAGSLASRFATESLGRRATILASALPFTAGSVIAIFAATAWPLFVTLFLWGCGTGMIGTVVPMYLAEIADKDIRGSLSLSTRIMFSLGSLLVMTVGPFISFKAINAVLLSLPPCFFIACWWIPESPYYHLKDGNVDQARKNLTRLKGLRNSQDLEDELKLMKDSVQNNMKRSSSAYELFTGKQYRKAIIIAAGLKLAQIMTGAQTIQQYLGLIMQESKATMSLPTVLIVFGAVRFVVGFMSTALVDRLGRRPLLAYSFYGTAFSLGLAGLYFFLQEIIRVDASALSTYGFVPFAGIIASNIISSLGYSSLIFVVPAEIFPMNVKAVALTALNIFGGVLAFVTTLGYQRIKDVAGLCGAFWIFASVALVGGLFVVFYVPETRGRSLEEIQSILQGDSLVADKGDVILNGVLSEQVKDEVELKFIDKETEVK